VRARFLLVFAGLLAALPADDNAAVPGAQMLRYRVNHAI
jgi:hypothetical protein